MKVAYVSLYHTKFVWMIKGTLQKVLQFDVNLYRNLNGYSLPDVIIKIQFSPFENRHLMPTYCI